MIYTLRKIAAVSLAMLMLFLCACENGNAAEPSASNKKDTIAPTGQKVESAIFGRDISYDGFVPADNISLPVETADILDMLEIEKTLYFLTDGVVYTLDIELGTSGKLFDTDAAMFATYGGELYTYAPESGSLGRYSAGGEFISKQVILIETEDIIAEDLFVTEDYYSIKCRDKSSGVYITHHYVYDRETLERVNVISEPKTTSLLNRVFTEYTKNRLIKLEESRGDSRYSDIYELNLDTGKYKQLTSVEISGYDSAIDITYSQKTGTLLIYAMPSSLIKTHTEFTPFIMECSLSDPDNIIHKRFYIDNPACEKVFINTHENIVSVICSADSKYRYFDYLNPPGGLTLAYGISENYKEIISGFEKETGIMVRTVSYGTDFNRLDIKLMAGDTDFDLFVPVYYHQHKYYLSGMFEDLSEYEGLKERLDGDLAASYVSKLRDKYVGIPIYLVNAYPRENYTDDLEEYGINYSDEVSRRLYLAQNIDVTEGRYEDPDGKELYKLLRFLYDNPTRNDKDMPFGQEIFELGAEFVVMNLSSTNKENAVKFLEYMFDVLNGDIEGVVPENKRYIDIESTDSVYVGWKIFAWDYVEPIYVACNQISQCDGKNSTIKKIAREAAAEVRMRLEE